MKLCNSSSSSNKTHSNNAQKVVVSESLNIKKDEVKKFISKLLNNETN